MIGKVLSVILHVVAGSFLYVVCMASFLQVEGKWMPMVIFTVLALVALGGALASWRFSNWKRETGILLISTSGALAFIVFSFLCFFMAEEYRDVFGPKLKDAYGDYVTGLTVIVGYAALGVLLLKAGKARVKPVRIPPATLDFGRKRDGDVEGNKIDAG